MRTFQIVFVIVLFSGAAVAVATLNRSSGGERLAGEAIRVHRVRAARVEFTRDAQQVRFPGIVAAVKRAKLSFTIGGRMESRPVEIGDHVEKGGVLARLDHRGISNGIASASAALLQINAHIEQVERDRRRFESLVKANASAAVKLERVMEKEKVLSATKAAAEVKLREAERLLEESTLRAPFAGTVTEVFLEPGEYATPGLPVVLLSGDRDLEIRVEVPESIISKLSVGDEVAIDLPVAGAKGLKGKIRYLGRAAGGRGRLFPVLTALEPTSRAVPGMTAEVEFRTDRGPALTVPLSAVINPAGQCPELFLVKAGKAEKVRVEVGRITGDRVTITGPLGRDDRVVCGGHLSLMDGDPVEVR
jgi:RND family efflux transporter MFP subunit